MTTVDGGESGDCACDEILCVIVVLQASHKALFYNVKFAWCKQQILSSWCVRERVARSGPECYLQFWLHFCFISLSHSFLFLLLFFLKPQDYSNSDREMSQEAKRRKDENGTSESQPLSFVCEPENSFWCRGNQCTCVCYHLHPGCCLFLTGSSKHSKSASPPDSPRSNDKDNSKRSKSTSKDKSDLAKSDKTSGGKKVIHLHLIERDTGKQYGFNTPSLTST